MTFLSGYKTYVVCLFTILFAVWQLVHNSIDANTAWEMILAALGAAGLRHSISTTKP